MSDFATKIRAEIQDSKKMRHDFVLRKFAFATTLLGVGSLKTTLASGVQLDLTPLLYLVPLVAIAFDVYIFTEDYRIKRAGEYLRRGNCGASEYERDWEDFAKERPNSASALAFALVTLIMLSGASLVLWKGEPNQGVFWAWLTLTILVEALLVIQSFGLRSSLERAELKTKSVGSSEKPTGMPYSTIQSETTSREA